MTVDQSNRDKLAKLAERYGIEPGRDAALAWVEPESIEHAEKMRNELISKVEAIDMQLTDPNRTDASGKRLTFEAYQQWRRSAVAAQKLSRQRLGQLRKWIGAQSQKESHGLRIAVALERIAETLNRIETAIWGASGFTKAKPRVEERG